jgi:hypothetical protein
MFIAVSIATRWSSWTVHLLDYFTICNVLGGHLERHGILQTL